MGKVFELNRKRVFTINEAREILPIIRRVTDETNLRVRSLLSKLEAIRDRDPQKAKDLEDEINRLVSEWQSKISKLGAEGKGLWLVDFDCGTGYFCWKFPEDSLEHFHGYTEGFQARVKMRDSLNTVSKVQKNHEIREEEKVHASPDTTPPAAL